MADKPDTQEELELEPPMTLDGKTDWSEESEAPEEDATSEAPVDEGDDAPVAATMEEIQADNERLQQANTGMQRDLWRHRERTRAAEEQRDSVMRTATPASKDVTLGEDDVSWDEETQRYVVKGEKLAGALRDQGHVIGSPTPQQSQQQARSYEQKRWT